MKFKSPLNRKLRGISYFVVLADPAVSPQAGRGCCRLRGGGRPPASWALQPHSRVPGHWRKTPPLWICHPQVNNKRNSKWRRSSGGFGKWGVPNPSINVTHILEHPEGLAFELGKRALGRRGHGPGLAWRWSWELGKRLSEDPAPRLRVSTPWLTNLQLLSLPWDWAVPRLPPPATSSVSSLPSPTQRTS